MAQIVNTFGDFIYEEPQTGGGTPISNATDFPPGFTEQIQTGGGTPIDAFTQPTYTPFLLNQIEIDEITIKKIYDLFPRSLRVEQLTSNELLDLLRSQVDEKDAEIQRLLEIIANFSETTIDLSTLESLLSSLGGELTGGILDALNNTGVQIDDAQLSQEIANLQARGFTRAGETLLFFKVTNDPTNSFIFNINHTREKRGFPESDLQTPSKVEFENIGDTPLTFTKQEKWLSNDDNLSLPRNTNAFNFINLRGISTTGQIIQPGESLSTVVKLNYKSRSAYDRVGLRRDNDSNTWYGDMILKVGSVEQNMGSMRLYRDRT